GSILAEPHAFTFETPRPAVQQVEPGSGFRWLKPRQTIAITVNQPLKDLERKLRLAVGGDGAFPFSVTEVRISEEKRAAEKPRRFARMPDEKRGFEDRRTRYEVTPRRPMPLDSAVTLSIVGPVAGVEGTLALDGNPSWSFRTYGPFQVTGVQACWWRSAEPCPRGPVALHTTNRFDEKTLAASVTFAPKVAIDWREVTWISPTEVHLPAVFHPGTKYRVAVSAAARDEFGQAIAAPFEGKFETSDVPPEYDVGSDLALIEAKGDGNLPVRATNVSRVEVRLVPLDPAALARALAGDPDDGFFDRGIRHRVDTSAKRNQQRTSPIPVRQLLAERKATLFALRTEAPDVPAHHGRFLWPRVKRVFGQVTDLAVHAKLGATKGLAWVTRLSDGKPVPGAKLALHDRTGAVRWTGATDGDGLAEIPGLATLIPGEHATRYYGETPFALVAAEAGGDTGVTLSTWSGGLEPSAFELPTDWEGTSPATLGGVFPERGIYRPGETVHVKGILRSRRLGRIETPSGGTARLTVT
ncbi:MAG TPA: alpha-2-macroglobulin, partial [Anaeromyxobacteraceae bacterium]|nr:alpha-2-macroglobulin [Anaeromyxobacteraceae bacterium]